MDQTVDCFFGRCSFVQFITGERTNYRLHHINDVVNHVYHNNSSSHYDDFPIPTSFYYYSASYDGTDGSVVIYIRSLGLEQTVQLQ
jgi:hypothetical protein